jgi:hypothetical protein
MTVNGKKRWRCRRCSASGIRTRKDNRQRRRLSLFLSWAASKRTLGDVAGTARVSARTLRRWFGPFLDEPPKPVPQAGRVLVLDATSIEARECVLLIAGDADSRSPVSWDAAVRESADSWFRFLAGLRREGVSPPYIVCDAQRGLLKAIREVWPGAEIQRCLIHVTRQARTWLTMHPKMAAGADLLGLVRELGSVRTKRQKRRWIRRFRRWQKRFAAFLKERTQGDGHWWYTHRKLRAVRSLIANAIPDLFRFVSDPTVPRTSNHVEGGLNARIKELLRCRRGLSVKKKLAFAAWYLHLRQGRKPTRNVR